MTAKTCTECGKPILLQIFKNTGVCSNACKKTRASAVNKQPYLVVERTIEQYAWNIDYQQDALCAGCGHVYHRHFDPYENMAAVGCKYDDCPEFIPVEE